MLKQRKEAMFLKFHIKRSSVLKLIFGSIGVAFGCFLFKNLLQVQNSLIGELLTFAYSYAFLLAAVVFVCLVLLEVLVPTSQETNNNDE